MLTNDRETQGQSLDAHGIAHALTARPQRTRHGWLAQCPAHPDRTPSLSLRDGENGCLLVRCFAGCPQEAVIDALRELDLWPGHDGSGARAHSSLGPLVEPEAKDKSVSEIRGAVYYWDTARPLADSLGEAYLRRVRHLICPFTPELRYAILWHGPSKASVPAIVALVRDGVTGEPIGIHRTFLRRDGLGKAEATPNKMCLGPVGGGAVWLCEPIEGKPLVIGEGIETTLAAMQASGLPGWSALSTSGLRALNLPAHVRDVVIVADGDDPGEEAAQAAAQRWVGEGRKVRIARPPEGEDFADLVAHERGGR
jgi:hypothetical protein